MSSANFLKKVAIVGAGGNCGKHIAEALLKSNKHQITALTRPDSKSELPAGIQSVKVDYEDTSSLAKALEGQDALVITLGVQAPPHHGDNLIKAAAEANVKWILPNEWGFDTSNQTLAVEAMMGHDGKKPSRDLITSLGKSSWTAVSTGFWYEWSLAIPPAYGFNFEKREVTFYDEGETRIQTSTWPQVGRAVASLLSLPMHSENSGPSLEQFRNKHCYVESFTVSQKDMFESVLRVTSTNKDQWSITKQPSKERFEKGREKLKSGDRMGFVEALYSRVLFPDGSGDVTTSGKTLSNDVLGLPKEDIDSATELAIQRAKENAKQWQ